MFIQCVIDTGIFRDFTCSIDAQNSSEIIHKIKVNVIAQCSTFPALCEYAKTATFILSYRETIDKFEPGQLVHVSHIYGSEQDYEKLTPSYLA
jgi:hypothetical protein